SLVGVGAARVRDLFAKVRAAAPAIVFIDELDAAARRRGVRGSSGGSDAREQAPHQPLVEIDRSDVHPGPGVVGATDRPAPAAAARGHLEEVHRVTILARGRGLGLTSVRMDSDAVLHTAQDLFGQLVIAFGGLAAEEEVLGESSTGAEQDLEHATELARELVGRYGMSERLGRVRLLARDPDEFLGAAAGLNAMSEKTHQTFDEEVRRLLDEAEKRARE